MASLNRAPIIGNLGSAPDIRRTQAGTAVGNFTVATTEGWGEGAERKESTEWHRVVVWGKLALTCGQYLKKGRQVYVEGRLQTRSYEDDQGGKRYTTEIVAREVQFLGSNGNGGSSHPEDDPEPGSTGEPRGGA